MLRSMTKQLVKRHKTVVDKTQITVWVKDYKKRTWRITFYTRLGFLPFLVSRYENKAIKEGLKIIAFEKEYEKNYGRVL